MATSPPPNIVVSWRTTHRSFQKGFRAAFPHIYSVSSGLSALVILFVPDDSTSTAITEILNKRYEEREVPIRRECTPVTVSSVS